MLLHDPFSPAPGLEEHQCHGALWQDRSASGSLEYSDGKHRHYLELSTAKGHGPRAAGPSHREALVSSGAA